MRPVLLPLALAIALPAAAFAPGDVYQGVEPQRIYRYESAGQHQLAQSPGWQKFAQSEGRGWAARFDPLTGNAHRAWGPGLPVDDRSEDALLRSVQAFFVRHAADLGVDPATLRPASAHQIDRLDRGWVDFDVVIDGHPIYRGGVTARVLGGKLVQFGVDSYPGVPRVGQAQISAGEASGRAVAQGPYPLVAHQDRGARLVWLPEVTAQGAQLRLAWEVRTETQAPRGRWVHLVDAASGALLSVHNEVRYVTGDVTGMHEIRTVDDPLVTSGMPYARVFDGASTFYADANGHFETTGPGDAVYTDLNGKYIRVINEDGAEGKLDITGPAPQWTTADATQAEIHSYRFLHDVREWAAAHAPEVGYHTDKLVSHVNLGENCNAYYDGDVNFFEAGSGCANTGRIADVNYHEWGHGFHYYSLEAGTLDGSLGEGASDVVAFLQTDDPIVAPGFMTNGDGIRNVDPDRRYPEDFLTNEMYVHDNGLIFGGAMWDLWARLRSDLGDDAGTEATTAIFVGLLKGGPAIETSFDEAAFADDDNGDLSDGSAHYCAIVDAFALHGLGPGGIAGPIQAMITPPYTAASGTPAAVAPTVFNGISQCVDWTPAAGWVSWRADGGAWQDTDLTVTDGNPAGAIPAQPDGTFVEWYVSVESTLGDVITAPVSAEVAPFSYYAGDVLAVGCEDFEAGDGGYTHELVDGDGALGADDWQWGVPMGQGGDPSVAHSGTHVWGNDLGDGDYNGEYQDNKHNRLQSPPLNTRHYQSVFLAYRRWLNVEDGQFDQATILADDAVVWSNHESTGGETHSRDAHWAAHVVSLGDAGDDGELTLAWDLQSDEGLTFGGWTLDDVCLFAPATPDNRLGISDFVAADQEKGGITLTWTNPTHAPVTRVVVVRQKDRFPAGPDDGDVVFDEVPELGAAVSLRDEDVRRRRSYFYAVYAFDGTSWLSWTREGLNADIGSTQGADTEDPTARGCGCDTGSPVGSVAGLAAIALVAARRRGRRG